MRQLTMIAIAPMLGLIAALLTPALAIPAGAYAELQTSEPRACARACGDDGLCIAWVQRAHGECELFAVAPASLPADASAVGLSSRAPPFAALPPLTQHLTAPVSAVDADAAAPPGSDLDQGADPAYALLGGPADVAPRARSSGPP